MSGLEGSVANTAESGDANSASCVELRGDSKDGVDKLALRDRIALSDKADLTLADCMHRLVSIDGSALSLYRSESQARGDVLFYEAMVLLDDVVQVGCRSAPTMRTEFTGPL
jgi:hypothetical protein